MMAKHMEVKVKVLDPIISYDKDTLWDNLEKYAKNSPLAYSSEGYCFNRLGDRDGNPYKHYSYYEISDEDMEKVRLYWTESVYEVSVETWDDSDEWPILNSDDIETRGMDA